jgi:hypothetical protein
MLPAVGKQWWPSRHRRFRRRGHKEVCGVAETETDHESGPDRRKDSDALGPGGPQAQPPDPTQHTYYGV